MISAYVWACSSVTGQIRPGIFCIYNNRYRAKKKKAPEASGAFVRYVDQVHTYVKGLIYSTGTRVISFSSCSIAPLPSMIGS